MFKNLLHLNNLVKTLKMSTLAPKIKLNNGKEIPVLGLGTYQSKPGEVEEAIKYAIDIGYRHIDCAYFYGNEKEIGSAINEKISEGAIKREDLFITSKLWNNSHSKKEVLKACEKSVRNFGLEYLDLYLIHWPFGFEEKSGDLLPTDNKGDYKGSDVDYLETWEAMEECLEKGLTKSIGISNFNSEQIERLLSKCKVKPVVNQVECHPYLNQKKLIEFCKQRDIVIIAYTPLGKPGNKKDDIIKDPKILELAKKYNKTAAQVVLRYLIQNEAIPIPKSSNKDRIKENFDVFDFELNDDDQAAVDKLNKNKRLIPFSGSEKCKYYPFHIEF